ncbi:hypothetical protein Pcinc_022730 [Petrolisthes cinctipes]|uniref:Uncharacterized protein n=1 Tax=Petrolisthes cinctipes TaxID=88211 RepID=A0AAE1FEZ7_PETCI|nr:hypothetical protein Pcinc_029373 [Petrolisthes cinctipes]KAK3872179.1 hypothetical protein Pcinc_022730 [Petrolisthes cinctipes]
MGEDRVSNVFKCESSAQLPQFPFSQVTTEKIYKAVAELAFIPATDSYTSSYTAAPSSYHLLSLPSVEDRGAETMELVKEDDLAKNRALSQFSGLSLLFWLAKMSSAPGTASAAFVSTAALSFVDACYSFYSSPLSFSTVCEVGSTINPPTLSGIDMAGRWSLLTLDPPSPAALEVDRTEILLQTVPHKSLLMCCTGTRLLSLGHIDSRQGLLGELIIPDLPIIFLTLQLHALQRLFLDRRLVVV